MGRFKERVLWVCSGCALSLFVAGAFAAPADSRPASAQKVSDQARAVEHFNLGIDHRDKAWGYAERAEQSAVAKERDEYRDKMRKEYEKALVEQRQAIALDPALFEAYSSMGYAQRKLGRYSEALKSYDRALALNADYMEAVEYRAEAYLQLNRFGEAQQAYELLFRRDPERAALLLLAFEIWVARGPEGVATGEVAKVQSWIAGKVAIVREMSGTTGAGQKEW